MLVNNCCTEASVLNQGSQIVVIHKDLANEVGTKINKWRTLHMEGATGNTSRTLGCAEDLEMRISDISFTIHPHVVHTALFCLLLGCPFHHLLLCRLEDHPDLTQEHFDELEFDFLWPEEVSEACGTCPQSEREGTHMD